MARSKALYCVLGFGRWGRRWAIWVDGLPFLAISAAFHFFCRPLAWPPAFYYRLSSIL